MFIFYLTYNTNQSCIIPLAGKKEAGEIQMGKSELRKNRTALILLVVLGAVLLFHTQYSFCQSDEPFYISTVKRLYQGDRLILDEWHPTQFYSPILLPFYTAFRFFAASDEGVILFFRLVTVLFSVICSLLLFKELKKSNRPYISFCFAALLMLFSRANIAGASYYNLNLYFSVLFFLGWKKALRSKGKTAAVFSIICGILVSLAVLCQPYTAIPAVGFLVFAIVRKSTRSMAAWTAFSILLAGTFYFTVFFMKDSADVYLTNLWYVINDPQHQAGLRAIIKTVIKKHKEALSTVCFLAAMGMSVWFVLTSKRGCRLNSFQVLGQIALVFLSIIKPLIHIHDLPCYSYFAAITVAAFPSFLYHTLRREMRTASALYALGISLAAFWAIGSNTALDAMLVGYVVSGIGGLSMIAGSIREVDPGSTWKKKMTIILSGLCTFMLLVSFAQRTTGIYRDAPITQLDTRIFQGPAKGLITTKEGAEQYNKICSTVRTLYEEDKHATAIHLRKLPWAYLTCDWKCYGPTSWTTDISEERLTEYYSYHGDRLPDYCFIYSADVGSYKEAFLNSKASDKPNEMEKAGVLYEKLNSGGYNIGEYSYMTVYNRRR